MPTTIELPEALEEKLRSWAQATNQSEEQIIRDALEAYFALPLPLREEMEAWQAAGAEAIEIVAPIANEAWLGTPPH
jgi:predicted transcriptional regulator